MSNERKKGWATITHRDGSSVTGEIKTWRTGEVKTWRGDECLVSVCGCQQWFNIPEDGTITYIDRPMPALPTEPGSVIEAGNGVRFMRTSGVSQNCWSHTRPFDSLEWTTTDEVSAYCREHGGFTVIAEGK